jgi:hypothetical protein
MTSPEFRSVPLSEIQPSEPLDIREVLINESIASKQYLASMGRFLVTMAIGEGDPARNIESDPLYIEAKERADKAKDAIDAFAYRDIKTSN